MKHFLPKGALVALVLLLPACSTDSAEKTSAAVAGFAAKSVALADPEPIAAPTVPEPAETLFNWKDTAIGAPLAPGRHSWDKKSLTLTGTGLGVDFKGADQLQFVSVARKPGDFAVVARLVDFTGESDSCVGIMARTDASPTGPMSAVYFTPKNNTLAWRSRTPGHFTPEKPSVAGAGMQLAQKLPLWLKMVRLGPDLAVYKSRDGVSWTMITNVSGGPNALEGPLDLGLFVASASEAKPLTATFDSISIGPADMPYITSWVGNTYGCRADNHVSNALSALWVAPDGTCYSSSYWDEAGQPVTSYRAGKVLRGLPIGTPQTAEGAITGDAKHLYVATVDHITELDPAASDYAPQKIYLSVSMGEKKSKNSVISGMASNGSELFVSDSRSDTIRVVSLEPAESFQVAEAANDGVAIAPEPVVVPEDDPRFAPSVVYQTQRIGEGLRYTIPGLVPDATYTLRGHFAEYANRPTRATHPMSIDNVKFDVFELAEGILKPAVKDFPNYKADASGKITFHFSGGYGGGICAFEILDTAKKRVFAMNCGGPPLPGFKGESQEQVTRNFPFERPGPMAFDKRGNLWIIQRGNDFPIGGLTTTKFKAAVLCFKPDGTPAGKAITDVVNPRALAYDSAKDQLLVAENGPDMNVRFYSGLDSTPVLAKTFGEKGGVYAGKNAGLVFDASAGDYARFMGISGVGVDGKGNLYVGGGLQGSDLRMFTPSGKLGWMLNSLMFCNTYDVDPDSDGSEIYGTYNHLHLDLSKTTPAPGSEQTYVGYNWDINRFGDPVRAGGSQSIVRRLGPQHQLAMFTSGQGTVGDVKIFRYQGEIAIPCGDVRANEIWIDANGDGKETPDEVTKMASSIGWNTALVVDSKGGLWIGDPTTGGSFMRHFFFKGVNDKGVPIYSGAKGDGYVDERFPEEGDSTNAWGMSCRFDYDADRDIMVCFYPAVPRKGEGDKSPAQYFVGRYDNWSKGNRKPSWKFKALTPQTDPDYFMYEVNVYPYSGYMGIKVAGDYLFMAYVFGEIHVYDLKTGKLAQTLSMGPEVYGSSAWEDAAMGLRVYQRKNGEYLIFTENSGWGGKNNFIRWKPK